MTKKTAAGLIEHCKEAFKNKVQYVYGSKMQVLTLKQIQNLRELYGGMVWLNDYGKAGKLCCDCSGLISSYTGIERSSTNYKETALQTISITQLKADWSKYIGWGLWLNGHIGVVSDTEGYYYAMDGSARNMVHFPLSRQPWVYAIKLKDIDYAKEDIDMDELKKLKQEFEVFKSEIAENREKVFENVEDVPKWGQKTVEKLVKAGALQGDGKDLDLSYTLLRLLVINDRMGLYD